MEGLSISLGSAAVGLFRPRVRDTRPAFRHFPTSLYVADTTLQARHFGAVPTTGYVSWVSLHQAALF